MSITAYISKGLVLSYKHTPKTLLAPLQLVEQLQNPLWPDGGARGKVMG